MTLELADQWGADVIRDSDGTRLSDEIVNAGYEIYSTICIIRDHNEWARAHMDRLQQTFLMSAPKTAKADTVIIGLLDGYFKEQFLVNGSEDSLEFWQVFDRTDNVEVPREQWTFDEAQGTVTVAGIRAYHDYTVNFLAY